MDSPLFQSKTFPAKASDKCACVIMGYRGKISSYKSIIKILNMRGYSVIAYEHTPSVLTKGKPGLLPTLVTQICNDFAAQAADYDEVICVGVSIGAGLCFAIQRQFSKVRFGLYAGAGVSPPETVYGVSLFHFVRKKFTKHGFTYAMLREAWKDVDILPDKNFARTPFIIALGKRDKVVGYEKALDTLHAWQSNGQSIQIITKPGLGHLGVIHWYKNHFSELLTEAEEFAT